MDWPKLDSYSDYESSLQDLQNEPTNPITKLLELIKTKCEDLFKTNFIIQSGLKLFLFLVYNAYLIFATIYHFNNNFESSAIGWCDGVGFLIICTVLVYIGVFYNKVVEPREWLGWIFTPFLELVVPFFHRPMVQIGCSIIAVLGFIGFLVYDTKGDLKRLQPCFGMILLIGLGVICSKHPGRIRWRHVTWGLGLQLTFGLLILRTDTGKLVLTCISDKVTTFLGFVQYGSSFVYGYLATGLKIKTETGGEIELPGVFAFQILSVIYLFSFFVAILYHFGVMTWIVSNMGWLLEISVGTTAAESMNASANIFLGMSEAPLVVKPYLGKMTNSELHAVMTGGFATVAGAALGAYVSFGVNTFHLLSASLMSAPAALMYAKILYPETKKSVTNSKDVYTHRPKKSGNFLDAASQGASQAIFLIFNIIASLIAITAFVGMLNSVLHWFGTLVGWNHITFEWIIGKIFTPLAWAIGIDYNEIEQVAYLLGVKTVVNEFVAYSHMSKMCLSPRSVTITTYALCCFANLSSIGVTLGALTALAPERGRDISKIVFRAFIGGNVAALLTACVAGVLSQDMDYDEWKSIKNCTNPSSNYF